MTDMSNAQELNLQTHRAATSVWDRRGWNGTREELAASRLLVGVGGAALAIQGMRQGTWTGRALASMGGALAWWALTGEGDLTQPREWFLRLINRPPWADGDRVVDASADSFPASDAPAWTPTVGTGLRRSPTTR